MHQETYMAAVIYMAAALAAVLIYMAAVFGITLGQMAQAQG